MSNLWQGEEQQPRIGNRRRKSGTRELRETTEQKEMVIYKQDENEMEDQE